MEVFVSGPDKWCPYMAKNIHIVPLTPSIDLGLYLSPSGAPPGFWVFHTSNLKWFLPLRIISALYSVGA